MKATIYTQVKDGRVAGREFAKVVNNLEGQRITITIGKTKRNRSNNQNRYFHGPMLDVLLDHIQELGNDMQKIELRELLKFKFLKKDILLDADTGEMASIIKSTADLNTGEWEDFMEQIRAWAAEIFGIEIPLPNEQLELK